MDICTSKSALQIMSSRAADDAVSSLHYKPDNNSSERQRYLARKYLTRWKENAKTLSIYRDSVVEWGAQPVLGVRPIMTRRVPEAVGDIQVDASQGIFRKGVSTGNIPSTVLGHFSQVSHTEFTVSLEKSWEKAKVSIGSNPYLLFAPVGGLDKSDRWVLGLLFKNQTSFQPASYFNYLDPVKPNHDFVVVDDGAYSGQQICGLVEEALQHLSEGSNIHVVIPFMSAEAKERISEIEPNSKSSKILIHSDQTIRHAKNVKPECEVTAQALSSFEHLILFSHKIADRFSLGTATIKMTPPYKDPENTQNYAEYRAARKEAYAGISKHTQDS